jgi:hypothetical protein
MGTNYASLSADLFFVCFFLEVEIILRLLHEKGFLAVVSIRHLDGVLFINNHQIHSNVDLIYPNVLEIKGHH